MPPKIFDADTDAWYEPGQLPALPRKPRPLELDPGLGMLPMLPFYQQPTPEGTGDPRALPPLPQVPKTQLPTPGMGAPSPYGPPQLSLTAPPGFGGMGATTADPMAAAGQLQGQPSPPSEFRGRRFRGPHGFSFEVTPDEERRLVEGFEAQHSRMGKSLDPLAGLQDDAAGTTSKLMAALSEFMDPEQAAQIALQVHNGELNRDSAEGRNLATLDARKARGGGGGGPTGGVAPKSTEVDAIFRGIRADFKVAALEQSERDLQQIINMTNSPNAFDQRSAIAAKVKEMSGATATDKEREFYLGGTGFWNSLEGKLNSVTAGGKMSPELMNQLRSHALQRLEFSKAEKAKAAEAAKLRVDMLGANREQLKQGFGSYYSGGGGGGGSAAPTDADSEADELLR
jgi:hypothetical protein